MNPFAAHPTVPGEPAYRAVVLDESEPADREQLERLRADDQLVVVDCRDRLLAELDTLLPRAEPPGSVRWAYFPWRRSLVSVLDAAHQRRLRLDRNRNKITSAEQERLATRTVGVVGLSVGHAVAHVLAMEGLAGALRLADFDATELSNLNRIPASLLDIGVNKAIVAARRIAEVDPYLPIQVYADGIDEANISDFMDGLDLIIDECDSLDMKTLIRLEARRRRLPVIMETNDRGLLDVERFDLEPNRPAFHGLFENVDVSALRALTPSEKAPYAMRIVEPAELSDKMAASLVEIGRTLSAWPQLASEVQLGAAAVAAAARAIGLGEDLPSGRVRVDLDMTLRQLRPPTLPTGEFDEAQPNEETGADDTDHLDPVLASIRLAPSGGNSQPWRLRVTGAEEVTIALAAERTSLMDVKFRGSLVAIGAATFNARVAAAHEGARAVTTPVDGGDAVVRIRWAQATTPDPGLAELYPAMLARTTNRNLGRREAMSSDLRKQLVDAARDEGADLTVLDGPDQLAAAAALLAASDRIRYLTPDLHAQMMSELRWPGRDRLDTGIDVRTVSSDALDLIKLRVAERSEVMTQLAKWNGGSALGDATQDRVLASSAVAVVTVAGDTPAEYVRGGAAMERVWIAAETAGLAVQPVSPVFLYARSPAELQGLSAAYWQQLSALQQDLARLAGIGDRAPVLVLQLSHHARPAFRSRRLAWADLVSSSTVQGGARA